MAEKFACIKCGRSCNNAELSGGEMVKKGEKRGEGKGPLFTSRSAEGLPVLDFEKETMQEAGGKTGLGAEARFVPEKYCFDSISRTKIVVSWKLEGAPCVFQKGKECGIYESRPLVCRHFPVLSKGEKLIYSGECSALQDGETKKMLEEGEIAKEYFAEQIDALRERLRIIERLNRVLGRLVAERHVFMLGGKTENEILAERKFESERGLAEFLDGEGLAGLKDYYKE